MLPRQVLYTVAPIHIYTRSEGGLLNFYYDLVDYPQKRSKLNITYIPALFDEHERVYGLRAHLVAISNYSEAILIVTTPGGSCIGCYERKVIWEIVEKHTGLNVTGYLVYVFIHMHDIYEDSNHFYDESSRMWHVLYVVSEQPGMNVTVGEHGVEISYNGTTIGIPRYLAVYNRLLFLWSYADSLEYIVNRIRTHRQVLKPEVEILYLVYNITDIPEELLEPVRLNFRIPACAQPVKPPRGQYYFDYAYLYYPRVNRSEPLPQPITENIYCPEGWSLESYETREPDFVEATYIYKPVTPPVSTTSPVPTPSTPTTTPSEPPTISPPGVSPTESVQVKDETQNLLKYIVIAVVVAVLGLVSWYVLGKHFSARKTAP